MTTTKPNGEYWDLNRPGDVEELKKDLELARMIAAAAADDVSDAQQQQAAAIRGLEEAMRGSKAAEEEVVRLSALTATAADVRLDAVVPIPPRADLPANKVRVTPI